MNALSGIRRELAVLRSDGIHGSEYLAKHAAAILREASRLDVDTQNAIVCDVIDTQPSMVQLVTLANTALTNRDKGIPFDETCIAYLRDADSNSARLAANAADSFRPYSSMLAYSASGSILSSLAVLRERGHTPTILCSESRPALEGIGFAENVAALGFPVVLCTDMALFYEMCRCSAVILGADAVSSEGVVNKVGTCGIACMAHRLGIPVIVVCSTGKFVPHGYPCYRQDPRDPAEVYDGPARIEVRNYYYDITPLGHVSTIITEGGNMHPGGLGDTLLQPLHPLISEYCKNHGV
jgi:translation initiation factor eIF-2B subunit delta